MVYICDVRNDFRRQGRIFTTAIWPDGSRIIGERSIAGAEYPLQCARNRTWMLTMTYILHTQRTNSKDWAPLVRAHRAQFLLTAVSLLSCACRAEDIVTQALEELGGNYVPERFQYGYVLRIVVQGALHHLRACPMTSRSDPSPKTGHGAEFSFKALPIQERVVLFLRDVLDYSRRDVSLLVGISDVQADRLLSLARSRLAGGTTAFPRAPIEAASAHLKFDIGQQCFTKELTSHAIG